MAENLSLDGLIQLGVRLPVSDYDRAIAFYCDHIGFDLVQDEEDPAQERRLVTLRFGNVLIELEPDQGAERRQNYRLFWRVGNLREALELITAGGGRMIRRMEYGIFCADPDGNSILVQLEETDAQEENF